MGGRGANSSKSNKRFFNNYQYEGEDLQKNNLYDGFRPQRKTNKYIEMDRISADGDRIIVRVEDSHLVKTRYGHALILDDSNVVFLKDFNVNRNYYGNEVMLNKKYWNVKKWGDFSDQFAKSDKFHSFDAWKKVAKAQEKSGNFVKWEDHYRSPKTKAILKNKKKDN